MEKKLRWLSRGDTQESSQHRLGWRLRCLYLRVHITSPSRGDRERAQCPRQTSAAWAHYHDIHCICICIIYYVYTYSISCAPRGRVQVHASISHTHRGRHRPSLEASVSAQVVRPGCTVTRARRRRDPYPSSRARALPASVDRRHRAWPENAAVHCALTYCPCCHQGRYLWSVRAEFPRVSPTTRTAVSCAQIASNGCWLRAALRSLLRGSSTGRGTGPFSRKSPFTDYYV